MKFYKNATTYLFISYNHERLLSLQIYLITINSFNAYHDGSTTRCAVQLVNNKIVKCIHSDIKTIIQINKGWNFASTVSSHRCKSKLCANFYHYKSVFSSQTLSRYNIYAHHSLVEKYCYSMKWLVKLSLAMFWSQKYEYL